MVSIHFLLFTIQSVYVVCMANINISLFEGIRREQCLLCPIKMICKELYFHGYYVENRKSFMMHITPFSSYSFNYELNGSQVTIGYAIGR